MALPAPVLTAGGQAGAAPGVYIVLPASVLAFPASVRILWAMRWFLLFLPWIELFTLIWLGEQIGTLTTMAYIFVTGFLGLAIVRLQGMEILARLRSAQGQVIVDQWLTAEFAVGLAGLLLLIPGLLTDALALLVFIAVLRRRPEFRRAWFAPSRRASTRPGARGSTARRGATASAPRPAQTLEGEFRRLADD